MSDSFKKNKLAEADTAVYGLLETLLSEVGSEIEPEIKTKKVLKKTEKRSITEVVEAETLTAETRNVQQELPEWGKQEFTALIFEAKGMKFAVPLVNLNSITPVPKKLTSIPGQPDWHLGISLHRGQQMVAVDVHKLLGLSNNSIPVDISKDGYLLVVGDGDYGLHCEVIGSPVTLLPKDVKWVFDHENKEWLAGMLPEQMCALLDIDGVITSMSATKINN